MSVLKRRAELLEQLIASTAHVSPGHPKHQTLARFCKEKIDFHSFLDTHPDVVTAEYAQLKERLEDNAQFDKVTALGNLSTRLENLNLVSSQLNFAQRQLSFLLAASRNVLTTVVDPEILAQSGINNTSVVDDNTSAIHPSEWSDDDDDSDAEWWANEVPYSPEDGLSVWSGEDEEEEEGNKLEGSGITVIDGNGSSFPPPGDGIEHIPDPTDSPLTPLTLARTAQRSPTRGHRQRRLSPLRRMKQPYSATSLSVWLAAKDSGGNPARQLDPRRCFTDSELVSQVINMLKGLQIPGLAFKFDSESETYRVSRGVHTSDVPPASIASLLTTFTALATHLRRIQTFCDAIVFTSAKYQGKKDNIEETEALKAVPTVAAFAAAVARQVVAIRGQLAHLDRASTTESKDNLNLLSLRLKLALMKRQVDALHAVVKECDWKGTAPCTASALLDTLYSVLETHLMRSGQHNGAVSAMLAEIFCAAWKPLNDALDIWLSNGSLAAAPPEFYIFKEEHDSSSGNNSTFWSEKYQLQWKKDTTHAIAAPALVAPLAKSLLHAGRASVGLTLSTEKLHLAQQTNTNETSPSLHTEFIQSLASIIEREDASSMSHTITPRQKIDNRSTIEPNINNASTVNDNNYYNNSNADGNLEDCLCLKDWTAAVARSPATAMAPLSEDISDLTLIPISAFDLPEAVMCPETTAFINGHGTEVVSGEKGEVKEEEMKRHPVAVAMHLASSARALQADAEKTDSVIAAEFYDTDAEKFGGALPQMLTGNPSGKFFKFSKKTTTMTSTIERNEKIPSDAASWAASLPLQVLIHRCLVEPIHHRMKQAEERTCEAILQAGLLTQLATMETVAAAAGPVLEPFVQFLLRSCSTLRGVDGISPFELNSALANALVEGEKALTGLGSLAVTIAPSAPTTTKDSSSISAAPGGGVCSISSLTRVSLTLDPSYPLTLIATDSFLKLHTMLWTLSLQLQWVAQSLTAARVYLWKESPSQRGSSTDKNDVLSTTTAPSTRAVQQEMIHLVSAVRQHMLTHVESANVRMRRGIATCGSLREMEKQCKEYEEELRHGCLVDYAFRSHEKRSCINDGATAATASASTELHSSLLQVLESSLRHCILLGHARQIKSLVHKAKHAQLEAEDAEQEALALESLELAEQKFFHSMSAVAATEREFEGHRVAFMERVSMYGSEAGAHSDAAKALLAAVDVEGRWQPQKADDDSEEGGKMK